MFQCVGAFENWGKYHTQKVSFQKYDEWFCLLSEPVRALSSDQARPELVIIENIVFYKESI